MGWGLSPEACAQAASTTLSHGRLMHALEQCLPPAGPGQAPLLHLAAACAHCLYPCQRRPRTCTCMCVEDPQAPQLHLMAVRTLYGVCDGRHLVRVQIGCGQIC